MRQKKNIKKDDENTFRKVVELTKEKISASAKKALEVNPKAANIAGRFELDLSVPETCGEATTASDVCTNITTNKTPCNHTKLPDSPRIQIDINNLIELAEREVTGLSKEKLEQIKLREDFKGVRARLILELERSSACGENNTLMSTCTKITTNTSPTKIGCLTPDRLPSQIINIDEILTGVRDSMREDKTTPKPRDFRRGNIKN